MASDGNRIGIGDVINAFGNGTAQFKKVFDNTRVIVADKYQALKDDDKRINRVCLIVIFAVNFYNAPISRVILFTVGFIGQICKDSLVSQSKKMEWLWTETQTIPTVVCFGGCLIAYRNFWQVLALGLGAYCAPSPKVEEPAVNATNQVPAPSEPDGQAPVVVAPLPAGDSV